MDTILGIIAFIIVLGLIIIVHEGGHFFFARRVNILCREFSFGMGPVVLKKKKGETQYSIRAFPIGGFCAIAGEEEELDPLKELNEVRLEIVDGVVKGIYLPSCKKVNFPSYKIVNYDIYDAKDTGNLFITVLIDGSEVTYPVDPKAMYYTSNNGVQIAPHNRTLNSKRKRDRAMVMFGGPLMNFVLALVVFLIAGLIQGAPNYKSSEIDDVTGGTPAYVAGLRDGDVITNLSSYDLSSDITKWDDISDFMDKYSNYEVNYPITVTYKRGEETLTSVVLPYTVCYNAGFTSDFTLIALLSKASGISDGSIITKLSSGTLEKSLVVDGDGYYTYSKDRGLEYKSSSDLATSFKGAVEFISEFIKTKTLDDKIKITYVSGNETREIEIDSNKIFYSNNGKITSIKFLLATYSEYNRKSGDNTELKRDDIIVEVNGKKVVTYSDIYKVFNEYVGENEETIEMVVERDNQLVEVSIRPYSKKLMAAQASTSGDTYPLIKNVMGVGPTYKFNLLQSFVYSGQRSLSSATVVFKTLGLLFTGGVGIRDLSGPVGIFSLTKVAAGQGLVSLLNLTGLLSVNIGIMNLLPIPALDGGRLVFLAYEAITKKRPNEKVETILITVTMILLLGLMIYVTFGDIGNIIKSCRG